MTQIDLDTSLCRALGEVTLKEIHDACTASKRVCADCSLFGEFGEWPNSPCIDEYRSPHKYPIRALGNKVHRGK